MANKRVICKRSLNSGFTLVETLIALALMSIIISGLFSVFQFGNKTFSNGSNQNDIQNDIRSSLDFITKELRNSKHVMFAAPSNPGDYSHIYSAADHYLKYSSLGGSAINKTGPVIKTVSDVKFRMKKVKDSYVLSYSLTATEGTDRSYTASSDVKLNNIKSFPSADLDKDFSGVYYLKPGSVNTVDSVAASITSITSPLPNETQLAIPVVPTGFSIAIKNITPASGVLTNMGGITPPDADTPVTIVFTVSDGTKSVDTQPIPVVIPAKEAYTAQSVAERISVMDPTADDTSIVMPTVPAGFEVRLVSSTPGGIIAADGKITFPETATNVTLKFEVKDKSTGETANTEDIIIEVPAEEPTGVVYTVTFNKNGGDTDANPSSITVNEGHTVVLPAPPARSGYVFYSWNTKSNGNGTEFNESYVVNGNITVFAQWKKQYTVTFDKNGGDTDANPSSIVVAEGSTVTLPAPPTRSGFAFDGWNTKSNGTGTAFDGSKGIYANTTVYAKWTKVTILYTITFDSAGGSDVLPIKQAAGTAVIPPAAPTKDGYDFTGWSPSLPNIMPEGDLSVTAQWTTKRIPTTITVLGPDSIQIPSSPTQSIDKQYSVSVIDQLGSEMTGQSTTWSVSSYANVSIDQSGKLTVSRKALSGTITITAKAGSISNTITVTLK